MHTVADWKKIIKRALNIRGTQKNKDNFSCIYDIFSVSEFQTLNNDKGNKDINW